MDHDSTDHPEPPRKARPGSQPDLPPQDLIAADVDPATSAAEEDDEARLPEAPEDACRGDCRRPAGDRPRCHRKRGAAGADLSRRLPHAQCRQRRAVRRQGEKRPQAAFLLRPRQRAAAGAHPAHDRGNRDGRDRLHHDRNRSAAAGSQPDQAAAAALQRATARRQVVSLHPDIRRPLGAADPQASRRANQARTIFRAVRIRRRRQPHHHGAAARVPDPLLHRRLLREPHAGPACSIRSAAARAPAPARSTSPAIPNWCARRTTSCPAAAIW